MNRKFLVDICGIFHMFLSINLLLINSLVLIILLIIKTATLYTRKNSYNQRNRFNNCEKFISRVSFHRDKCKAQSLKYVLTNSS